MFNVVLICISMHGEGILVKVASRNFPSAGAG